MAPKKDDKKAAKKPAGSGGGKAKKKVRVPGRRHALTCFIGLPALRWHCWLPARRAHLLLAGTVVISQKWSKGKVKEKLANLVLFDKGTYEKMLSDVPKQKLITPSIISEKLKVNGSLARKAIKELSSKNLIRECCAQLQALAAEKAGGTRADASLCSPDVAGPILTHKHQAIYTRATNT